MNNKEEEMVFVKYKHEKLEVLYYREDRIFHPTHSILFKEYFRLVLKTTKLSYLWG